jgi:hypothetical protein
VIAVGRHDESAQDVYAAFLDALDLPLTRRSRGRSARRSSTVRARGDESADFYRNFYRTG